MTFKTRRVKLSSQIVSNFSSNFLNFIQRNSFKTFLNCYKRKHLMNLVTGDNWCESWMKCPSYETSKLWTACLPLRFNFKRLILQFLVESENGMRWKEKKATTIYHHNWHTFFTRHLKENCGRVTQRFWVVMPQRQRFLVRRLWLEFFFIIQWKKIREKISKNSQ